MDGIGQTKQTIQMYKQTDRQTDERYTKKQTEQIDIQPDRKKPDIFR